MNKKYDGKINKELSYRASKVAGTWNIYKNGKYLKHTGIDGFNKLLKQEA